VTQETYLDIKLASLRYFKACDSFRSPFYNFRCCLLVKCWKIYFLAWLWMMLIKLD